MAFLWLYTRVAEITLEPSVCYYSIKVLKDPVNCGGIKLTGFSLFMLQSVFKLPLEGILIIRLYSTLVNETWLELWVITVMLVIKMIIN